MATYTYDPALAGDMGLNQMRFELGDIFVKDEGVAAILCDEEYLCLLDKYSSWKVAKYHCIDAVCARLAYQVDRSVGGMSLSLGQMFERLLDMKKSLKASLSMPAGGFLEKGAVSSTDGGHYFRLGMHDNLGDRGDV